MTEQERLHHRTEFAFASGDHCQCHRHNGRRCRNTKSSIGLKPADNPDAPMRTYCLDCWIECRTERTVPEPGQQRMYQQMREDGTTPTAMGC